MNIGKLFAYVGLAAGACIVLVISIKDAAHSKGQKEKRYVLFANGILWSLLLLGVVFIHLNTFLGIAIYYLATQHIQRRLLDIRVDEGIQEFKQQMQPQQGVPGYRRQSAPPPER